MAHAALPKLQVATLAALSETERAAFLKVRWHDRLVSLWAPVTVFALIFGVYLTIVEFWVCSSLWLQPVMQVLGLIAFAWWASLVVARIIARGWEKRRQARYAADETVGEVDRLANKHRAKLEAKAWAELVDACAVLARAYSKSHNDVEDAAKKLDTVAERQLAKFRSGSLVDFGSGFVRALMVALAFRAVLIEPYKIPSGSMIPTLEIGDQIFVNKFIYGVRLPFTNYVPFIIVRPPKRGDVIVFNNPAIPELDYIKRVIGVPGDRLEFSEEGVRVNGQLLDKQLEAAQFAFWDNYQPQSESFGAMLNRWRTDDWRFSPDETLFRETLDGQPHYILENQERAKYSTYPRMLDHSAVVPEGHVFVMGDNRNNSEDGRFGLSDHTNHVRFVPYGNIKGKATVIWLSLARGGFGSGFFGGTGIRYDRFFKSVTMCGTEAPLKSAERNGL